MAELPRVFRKALKGIQFLILLVLIFDPRLQNAISPMPPRPMMREEL